MLIWVKQMLHKAIGRHYINIQGRFKYDGDFLNINLL